MARSILSATTVALHNVRVFNKRFTKPFFFFFISIMGLCSEIPTSEYKRSVVLYLDFHVCVVFIVKGCSLSGVFLCR